MSPPVAIPAAYQHFGQWERAPTTGRLHFQGMLTFTEAKTLTAVKKMISLSTHVEAMKGSVYQSYLYCTKDDTSLGAGYRCAIGPTPQKKAEKDSKPDVAVEIQQAILAGASLRQLALDFPQRFLHSANSIKLMHSLLSPVPQFMLPAELLPWQLGMVEYLKVPANDRTIVWVYDPQGNNGKTTAMKYCMEKMDAIQLRGKVADMAYLYNGEPIVFFDLCRSSTDETKYLADFAEQLKNGTIVSTKYEVKAKRFKPPHVIFLSNSPPWDNVWTSDRCKMVQLSQASFTSTPSAPPVWYFD